MSPRLRRRAGVIAIALAALLVPAGPASAAVVNTTVVGASRIDIGSLSYPLPPGCVGPTATLDLAAGAADVTALSATRLVVLGGTTYILELSRMASTAGTVAGASPAGVANIDFTVKVEAFARNAAPCTKGAQMCDAAAVISLNGGFSGNPAAPAAGKVLSVGGGDDAGGLQVINACQAPFAAWLGEAVFLWLEAQV